jgi:hypothetical protein
VLEVCVETTVSHRVNCTLLVSDFNNYSPDIYKTIEYQILWKLFWLFLSIFTCANWQSDGRIVLSRRSAVFQTHLKAAWSRPAGKMMHSVGQDKNSLSGCMSTGLPEYETEVLITQPRRRNLLKLTPLGYAVLSNDLERLWNEAALFMLLSLTFFCRDWRKTRKILLKIAEICKSHPNRRRHYGRNELKPNPVLCVPKVKYDGQSANKFTWPLVW